MSESETELKAGVWVGKDHPRVVFRGALDSLEADVLEAQVLAFNEGEEFFTGALGEVLDFLRELMSAEVNERQIDERKLFGFSLDELHKKSREVPQKLPDYTMGGLAVCLNTLRTRVREAEIAAVKAKLPDENIAATLNRLSSAVYWLFCKSVKE